MSTNKCRKISFQFVYNVMMPALMLIFIGGGVITYTHFNAVTNSKFVSMETRHHQEIENVKEEILSYKPLDIAAYFESTPLIMDYMRHVNPRLTKDNAEKLIGAINIESQSYPRVSEANLLFTAQIETDFRIGLKSKTGAVGLMQVQPDVWLESQNPNNSDNLSQIGITTVEQLETIEGSVAAAAWILNVYALECEEMQEETPSKFYNRYKTIPECQSKKYFGGNHEWYFGRLKKAAGSFWFWMVDRDKNPSSQPAVVNFELSETKKSKV